MYILAPAGGHGFFPVYHIPWEGPLLLHYLSMQLQLFRLYFIHLHFLPFHTVAVAALEYIFIYLCDQQFIQFQLQFTLMFLYKYEFWENLTMLQLQFQFLFNFNLIFSFVVSDEYDMFQFQFQFQFQFYTRYSANLLIVL